MHRAFVRAALGTLLAGSAMGYGVIEYLLAQIPTNYLDSSGAVIWDIVANAPHNNNIAGIGRDDGSALIQRQSQSINTAASGNVVTVGLGTIAADSATNPNNFAADRSFLMWGDDGGVATFSTPIAGPAGISANNRLTRIWRVQETGAVGTVTVAIPLAAANRTAHLVASSDATFDAADTWIPLSSLTAGASSYWAADVDLTTGQFFTFAQTPAAAGGVSTNQVLWLPADAGIAASDGQQVPQWTNQVLGSTYHVTQATAGARPLYFTITASELVNFNPSVRFDGADDELRNPARLYANTAGWQVFAVGVDRRTSLTQLRGTVGIGSNGNDPGLDLQTDGVSPNGWNPFFDGSSPAEWSGGAALLFNGNSGGPNRQPQIFALGSANPAGGSNNVVSWVDGFEETTTLDSFQQADLGAAIFVGSSDDAQWLGLITEVVAFNRLLLPGEIQQVNSYLALKYGVTLDQRTPTSYLDSGGGVIWDATANSTHRFNIAGLGRDDGQLLDQTQSASVNLGNVLTIGVGTIATTNAANLSSLPADRSFFIAGDDAGSTTLNVAVTPPGGLFAAQRMARTWKVQETGSVGSVVAAVPSGTGGTTPLFLVVSNDTTFDGGDQWIPTAPLAAGATSYRAASVDFMSGQFFTFASALTADFGDAPASYATLVANDGARHAVPNHDAGAGTAPLMLGARIDTESDGQPTALADGDDTAGVDDEDGVAFPPLVAGQSANLTVTVANTGAAARLNAWADLNNNGSFADAGEQFATSRAVSVGANTVPIGVPASARGATAFRFRLSTQATLGPTGLAPDGEVEDYLVTIVAQPDLAIIKTDGQASYVPGASIAYTLTVTNGGPAASVGFTVNDIVPGAITGVAATCVVTGAGSCGANASAGNNVSFTGLSLAPGAANHLAITVTGTVSISTTGDLVNTATVSAGAGEIDPVTTNNSATDTDAQGAGVADLAIAKSDGRTGYVPGTPISYTVTVTNAGPSNAAALDISDAVPAAITGVAATCVSAGTASCGTNASSGNTVSFTGAIVNAGAGNSLAITISGTISPSASGTLVNTATASVPGGASYSDPNLGNNSASDANTAGTPQVDLAIAKTDGQASYVPGAPITYTLTVTNAGPSLATGFSVEDVVPPAISGVAAACTVVGFGSCGTNATAGGTASLTNLSLAPGAGNELAISVTGTVSPDTTGALANTATVTAGAGTSETALGNNSATDTDTQGAGVADLAISKTDGQAGYVAGTPIAYTIAVTNAGPSHAPAQDIVDVVPAMIAGVTVSCIPTGAASCGTNGSAGNNIAFTGASLNAGAANTLTLTISGTIDPSFVGGNIVNTVQAAVPAAAGYSDPSLGNNTATDIDTPLPQQVDLAIAKTDGQTSSVPGAAIAYTLTVTNAGPSMATDVEMTDFVPSSITGVTASCVTSGLATCGTNASVGNTVDFTNLSVAPGPGNQLTFTITGTVSPDATGPLANTATVMKGSNATEANLANNGAIDSDTQAAGVADLVISKTDGATTYTPGTPISYLVEVTNRGPSHAAGFDIDDVVPADVAGVSVSCSITTGIGNCGANASTGNTIAFSGASLDAGAAIALLVTGTTNPSATGNLVNTATVTVPAGASFSDPDPLSNTATDADTPNAQTVDLAIAKSDGQASYVAGTPIMYTLTVTNAGPSTATGVIIRDTVPAAVTGVSLSCAATGTSTCGSDESTGSDLISNNATVVPGDTLTFTIGGTVSPETTGDLVNTATVTAGPTAIEGNTANNTATDTDTAGTPQIDLGIAKTDNATSYVPGTVVSYAVTVTNAGPSTATGFSVSDVVPAALTGVTATCAVTGTADCGIDGSAGNTASFTGASLAPGAANALTVTITGTVSPSAAGTLINTATVTAGAGSTDTNPANDSVTDTDTQGTSVVDLAITKDDGRASYVPGTPITYTVVVVNAGPSLATGVSVNDPAPVAITGVTANCVASGAAACGTNASAGNTVSFTGASLPPGAANGLTITVSGVVSPSATGTLINTAMVAAGAGATDPTAANNNATDVDTAGTPQVDLAVTKTDGQDSYVPGTPISYTVLVTNAGPSEATGVGVSDVVPASITGVTATCVAAGTAICGTNGSSGNNVTFSGASVSPGAGNTLTLTIGGTVNASATGSIANTVTVTAGTASADTNPTNNSATDVSSQEAPLADLALTKTAVDASVVPGGSFTYRLVVTNNGPSVAADVAITDPLPAPLTFVSSPQGCTAAGQTVTCGTLASLAPAASFTFDIVVRLDPSYTGNGSDIGNVATASSSTADPVPGNETTPPAPPAPVGAAQADVQIVKHVSAAQVLPGETYSYTLQVTNNGPSVATGVVAKDVLPPQTAFVSSTAGCTAAGASVTCPTVATLAVGASVTFDLVVQLSPAYTGDGSDILNSSTVTAATADPALANNTSPAGAPPVGPPGADVTIVKDVSADPVTPGTTFTYRLLASNQGPSNTTNVVVSDPLPADLVFASSPEGCSASGQTVTCPTIATLLPGASASFTLVVQLDASYAGNGSDLQNRASVSSATADPVPGNNTSNPATPIVGAPSADVAIAKSVVEPAVSPGENLTYRLVITNAGPSTALGIAVSDTLPAQTTFVGSPSACTASGAMVTCPSVPTLAVGASATYDIIVRLAAGYTGNGSDVTNVAAITPSTPDPNASNNTTPLVPLPPVNPASADLSVTKSVLEPSLVPGQLVTYRITVANGGPANAVDVVTVDTLPAAMTFVSSPSSCTAAGQTVTCPTIASLGVGATGTFDIVARLDPSYQGNGSDVINSAVVSAATADADPGDNTTPPSVLPPVGPASADLSLVKTASAISMTPGGTFPYRIDVTNAGPSTAAAVVVSDPLPAALAFVSSASGCTGSGQTVTCPTVGALRPGAMATFEFIVQLDAAYVGDGSDLANTASVSSTTADPNGANNSSTAAAPPFVPAVADVAVNLSVSNAAPTIGDTVVFTVTAANLGPNLVTGLVVSANLPSGLAFVSADQPAAYNPATGLWTIGTLPAGGSVTLQITASVTEAGLITMTALKTGGQQIDPNTANDSAAVGLNAVPNADVALSKSVDVSAPNVGDTVTFGVTAGNRGPSPAAGLVVTDEVPPGLTLVSATPSQGTFNAATHQWTLGTLDVGAVATLALAVRVDAAGPASNTAFVSARGQLDLNEINDTATVAINGQAVANIGLTKAVSRPEALVGEQVSFQIAVTNHGPSPRPSLAVLDRLPAGLTFVSATASQGAYDAGTGTWTVGSLVPTQSAVLEIVATLAADSTFVNAASVIPDPSVPPDLNEGDNSGTAVVTVQPVADVVVSVSGPGTAHQGERVTWTVRVRNDGPSGTSGVRAIVALPPGLELVSAAPSAGTFDAGTGEWVIGALPLGAAAELTLATDVTGAGQLVLEASRTASDVFDPVTANNQSAAALQAINTADLQVQLTVDRTAPALGESVQLLLRVTNAGPVRVTGLVASLPLPPGVTLVSSAPSSGAYNPGDGSWTIGTLPVGGEVLLTLTAQVTTTAPVTILAQTIAFAQSDPQPANNQSGVVLQAQAADLQLVKTVDRPQLPAGERAHYRLVVTNNGPSAATGVVVTEQLPAALTYVSHTASQGIFDPATGAWTVGTLAAAGAGSYATLEIEVLVMGGGVSNAAAVTALDQTDATPSNNVDQQSVVSEAWSTFFADLVLQGTVSPPVATPGQPLTFQLAGINRGPTYVLDAFITGDVPAGTTFESVAVSPGGACETPPAGGTGVVICTWAGATRLGQGVLRSMALTVRTNPDAAPGSVITGRFRISSATPEYYEPSNSIVVSTSVAGATAADLAVTGVMLSEGVLGTDLPVPVGVGTPMRFTVTNVGPTTSRSSRWAIEIPEPEMPFVQILAIGASAGIVVPTGPSSGEWTLGALAPGESASFDLTLAYHRMWAMTILMRRVESAPADPNSTNDRALLVLDGVGDPGGSERYTAIGNVTGGSLRDVVTGAGRLETPQVRIYRGDSQDTGVRFYAYDRRFVGGVRVATCDVDADGIDEIVTAPGYGPGPHVRVLTLRGGAVEEIVGFYAFDPNFPGGVYPACTDLDGDGRAEVIAAMGIGGSPEVRIFAVGPSRADQIGSFVAYEPTFSGGVRVAAVKPGTAGASAYRILTAPGPGRPVEIRAFHSTGVTTTLVRTLPVTGPEYQLGAFLTVGDVNADGMLDVVLASDAGIPALVAGVTLDTGALLGSFQPFGPSFMGGARVSLGDIDADGRMELLVSPGLGGRPVVDTYTIENGLLLRYRLNPIELPF